MPERRQLRRGAAARGWKLGSGARSVARPSRWGNPFRITPAGSAFVIDEMQGLSRLRRAEICATMDAARRSAVRLFAAALLAGELPYTLIEVRAQLAGLDLACWCPPLAACHADVLLVAANEEESQLRERFLFA